MTPAKKALKAKIRAAYKDLDKAEAAFEAARKVRNNLESKIFRLEQELERMG